MSIPTYHLNINDPAFIVNPYATMTTLPRRTARVPRRKMGQGVLHALC